MIFNKLNVCSLILLLYLVHGFVSTGRHFTRELSGLFRKLLPLPNCGAEWDRWGKNLVKGALICSSAFC